MANLHFPVIVPVRGVSFHQDVVAGLRIGDPVTVVAEPDNPYDVHACAVHSGGRIFGHLPRVLAERLRNEGGSAWAGEVAEVLRGDRPSGVRVRIVAVTEPVAPHVAPNHGDGDELAPTPVSTRSGRLLGQLAGSDERQVRVRTPNGRTVTYPVGLVVVGTELTPPGR